MPWYLGSVQVVSKDVGLVLGATGMGEWRENMKDSCGMTDMAGSNRAWCGAGAADLARGRRGAGVAQRIRAVRYVAH